MDTVKINTELGCDLIEEQLSESCIIVTRGPVTGADRGTGGAGGVTSGFHKVRVTRRTKRPISPDKDLKWSIFFSCPLGWGQRGSFVNHKKMLYQSG